MLLGIVKKLLAVSIGRIVGGEQGVITPAGCVSKRYCPGAIEPAKPDYRLMVNRLLDRPLVFI